MLLATLLSANYLASVVETAVNWFLYNSLQSQLFRSEKEENVSTAMSRADELIAAMNMAKEKTKQLTETEDEDLPETRTGTCFSVIMLA